MEDGNFLKKNEVYTVEIKDISNMGNGVSKINGIVVFVEQAIPKDILQIKIVKSKKTYAYGKIIKILSASPNRTKPICKAFKECGGCDIMHMTYESQLGYKIDQLIKSFESNGTSKEDLKNVLHEPSVLKNPYYYRNKVIIPISEGDIFPKIGFFKKNSHEIVDFIGCKIQKKENESIILTIKEEIKTQSLTIYCEKTHKGLLRNIFIRQGHVTKEIMVAIIVNSESYVLSKKFVSKIVKSSPNIKSVIVNYNNKKTNVALGTINNVMYGRDYIEDYVGNIKLKISLNSFYQINSELCNVLYNDILDIANFSKTETVLDVYCGIGTITLFLSKHVKRIIGLECVEESIKDAKINCELNFIKNAEFFCGLAEESIQRFNNYDVIVLDPPRKGLNKEVINAIINVLPKKIFYISCNPQTLARDINLLSHLYNIGFVKAYDFFAHSLHIETMVYLTKK